MVRLRNNMAVMEANVRTVVPEEMVTLELMADKEWTSPSLWAWSRSTNCSLTFVVEAEATGGTVLTAEKEVAQVVVEYVVVKKVAEAVEEEMQATVVMVGKWKSNTG